MAPEVQSIVPLLWIYDMPTSIRFYRDRLGFAVLNTSPAHGIDDFDWAMLETGGGKFMLNTIYEVDAARPARSPSSSASQRDAWLYFDCPDVETAVANLRSTGLEVHGPSLTYYGMKQAFLHDPDGYRLCFQSASQS
jgi:glyoxylase I family protein